MERHFFEFLSNGEKELPWESELQWVIDYFVIYDQRVVIDNIWRFYSYEPRLLCFRM